MQNKPLDVDFGAPLSAEADQFLAQATAEFNARQKALDAEWLADFKQWGFDQRSGIFRLQFRDDTEAHFDGQILGSYSAAENTWEWAWNNPWVEADMARDSHLVRDLGRRLAIDYLRQGMIPLPDGQFVSHFCAIALKATQSLGVYRGACIFHNRPDHPAGAGCAFHVAALRRGEDPIDWKPQICWQVPLFFDSDPTTRTTTVRASRTADWGQEGIIDW